CAKRRIVLIQARIALAGYFDVVRTISQSAQLNGRGDGRLAAPDAAIGTPAIMGEAGAIRPIDRGNAVARAIETNVERGGGSRRHVGGFSGDGSADGNDAAFVASVRPRAQGGRARPQTKPIPHHLRLGPTGEVRRLRKLRNVFEQRVVGGVPTAG